VNIANHLPQDRFRSYLCSTRAEGPLVEAIAPRVARLALYRSGRFDVGAVRELSIYMYENQVRILHAHGTSLFSCRTRYHSQAAPHCNLARPFWPVRHRGTSGHGSTDSRHGELPASLQSMNRWLNGRGSDCIDRFGISRILFASHRRRRSTNCLACGVRESFVSRIFGPKKITPIYLPRCKPFGVGCQTHI